MFKIFRRSENATEGDATTEAPCPAADSTAGAGISGEAPAVSVVEKGPLSEAERAQLLAREAQAARAARVLHQQKRDTAKAVSEAATRAARDIGLFES